MRRFRLFLVALLALGPAVSLAGSAAADDDETTTTTSTTAVGEPGDTETTTTTTTTEPAPPTSKPDPCDDETDDCDRDCDDKHRRRCHDDDCDRKTDDCRWDHPPTTSAPAPQPVGAPAAAEPARPVPQTVTTTATRVTTATSTTVATLADVPIERPTTKRPTPDRSELGAALVADREPAHSEVTPGGRDMTVLVLLGAVAIALLGAGGFRRWMERG